MSDCFTGDNIGELKITRGSNHNFLGMQFNIQRKGEVKITMHDFVNTLTTDFPDSSNNTRETPASDVLFQVRPETPKLLPQEAQTFHSFTAKLLYLSKRTRGDISLAVAFLCTRVKEPDRDDWNKLTRVIKYL